MSIVRSPEIPTGPVKVGTRKAAPDPNKREGLSSRPTHQEGRRNGVKEVRACQPYWLNLSVPFTSQAGETKAGSTNTENFDVSIRGAWTDLEDIRARLYTTGTSLPWSTSPVPLLSIAGRTDLAHPMQYFRKPFTVGAQSAIRGDFINDGGEAAGRVVFLGERTEKDIEVEFKTSRAYWLLLDLGLTGGATTTGQPVTNSIEYPLLVYGMLSTSASMSVRFFDTSENYAFSADKLPIGAFAGIRASGNVQPIVYFPKPYFLPSRATIRAEWTNTGSESGKYVAFICERIL